MRLSKLLQGVGLSPTVGCYCPLWAAGKPTALFLQLLQNVLTEPLSQKRAEPPADGDKSLLLPVEALGREKQVEKPVKAIFHKMALHPITKGNLQGWVATASVCN